MYVERRTNGTVPIRYIPPPTQRTPTSFSTLPPPKAKWNRTRQTAFTVQYTGAQAHTESWPTSLCMRAFACAGHGTRSLWSVRHHAAVNVRGHAPPCRCSRSRSSACSRPAIAWDGQLVRAERWDNREEPLTSSMRPLLRFPVREVTGVLPDMRSRICVPSSTMFVPSRLIAFCAFSLRTRRRKLKEVSRLRGVTGKHGRSEAYVARSVLMYTGGDCQQNV